MRHPDEEPVDKSVVEQDQSGRKEEVQQCCWGRKIGCMRKIGGRNFVFVMIETAHTGVLRIAYILHPFTT